MNRQALIDAIATETGVTKTLSGKMLNVLLEIIPQALKQGDSVPLPGFGVFKVTQRAARTGRNPKTGEKIRIAARKTVKFTAGKAFKEALNPTPVPKKAVKKK